MAATTEPETRSAAQARRTAATGGTAVIVLGMHRSGTSALTRVLNMLGVALGENLMAAATDNNEAGFWEHQGVVDVHDRLLKDLGMRWDDPRAMPADWLASEAAARAQAALAGIIDDEFAGIGLWGVKDPRMCRLLPLWRPLLKARGVRPAVVHMVRHPLEIARSIERRDGLPRGRSLLLWLRHQIEAIEGSAGWDQAWCNFDALMSGWRETIAAVDAGLALDLRLDDAALAAEISAFLNPGLRHHVLDAVALSADPALADWVGSLHGVIGAQRTGQGDDLTSAAARIGAEIDRAGYYLDDTFRSFQAVEIRLREEIDRRDDVIRLRDEQLHERVGQIVERDARLAERLGQIAERDAKLAEREGRVAERDARIAERDGHIGNLQGTLKALNEEIAGLRQHYDHVTADLQGQIAGLLASTSWRWSRPIRVVGRFTEGARRRVGRLRSLVSRAGGLGPLLKAVVRVFRAEGFAGLLRRGGNTMSGVAAGAAAVAPGDTSQEDAYRRYIETMEPRPEDLLRMATSVPLMASRPRFSIVVPVYNVEERWLRAFIESVRAQVYPDWELCIADDCSTEPWVRPVLEEYAALDPRVRVTFRAENGRISLATNTAMEMATGDYICLMDNDDEIAPDALHGFARMLNEDPSLDMIYSDEDKIALDGSRYEPFFKPDWSPEALEGCMYTAHFACYRTELVRRTGGFRPECDGAQDYDFVLRFTELAGRIAHIPKVFYHWRAIPGSTAQSMEAKDYVLDSAIRALEDRAKRVNGAGSAKVGRYKGSFEVRYAVTGNPLVSAIIPSAGRMATIRGLEVDLLANAVRSIHEKNTWRNFEVIVVDNGDLRPETKAALAPYDCRFVTFEGDFNIATKMNMGAKVAKGDHLLFLNDDIEVIAEDWMECMLQLSQRPGVGAVGAKLFFENGTLQHVGVAFCRGLPDHINREAPGDSPGHFFSSVANRNYTAVTGAVMMTPAGTFRQVGGFDERFRINYNDIDYCAKLHEQGQRVVFAAGAELYHYESISRARSVSADEIQLFLEKWGSIADHDPYYSAYFESRPPNFRLRGDWVRPQSGDATKEGAGA